jgi:hypothetical protein
MQELLHDIVPQVSVRCRKSFLGSSGGYFEHQQLQLEEIFVLQFSLAVAGFRY